MKFDSVGLQKNQTPHKYPMQTSARLFAVQALFQMEATGSTLPQTIREFEAHRIGTVVNGEKYSEADRKLFTEILNCAVKNQGKIDKTTNKVLKDTWPLGRIDPTLRALFRAASSELLIRKTPKKVVINEFVEIAKAFFSISKEAKLTNAVLDKLSQSF